MLKLLLILFAVAVFACVAFNVINGGYTPRWEAGALAAFIVSFLPFPDVALPARRAQAA